MHALAGEFQELIIMSWTTTPLTVAWSNGDIRIRNISGVSRESRDNLLARVERNRHRT